MWFFIVLPIFIYIVGVFVYVACETTTNIEFHEGGFLGLGYTTNDNRETLPKDVRMGLIWPLVLIWWMLVTTVWIFNDTFIPILLLIFGFNYKKTKLYQLINRYTDI